MTDDEIQPELVAAVDEAMDVPWQQAVDRVVESNLRRRLWEIRRRRWSAIRATRNAGNAGDE